MAKKGEKVPPVPKLARKRLTSLKAKKKYKKQKCAFVSADGTPCTRYAKGKSTLCKKHGANIVPVSIALTTLENLTTIFDESFHPMQYITLAAQGYTMTEIASNFKVNKSTLNAWAERSQSFALALQVGVDMTEAFYTAEARGNLSNPRYNTALFKYLTGNTIGWAEKIEAKNTNLTMHGVLAVPDAPASANEWEEKYSATTIDVPKTDDT